MNLDEQDQIGFIVLVKQGTVLGITIDGGIFILFTFD
jgi:hypothetical protein